MKTLQLLGTSGCRGQQQSLAALLSGSTYVSNQITPSNTPAIKAISFLPCLRQESRQKAVQEGEVQEGRAQKKLDDFKTSTMTYK